jgi:hypothetical protein
LQENYNIQLLFWEIIDKTMAGLRFHNFKLNREGFNPSSQALFLSVLNQLFSSLLSQDKISFNGKFGSV